MSLKPWREVIVPHPDVLNGTFQQSEFAADLSAVRTGRATPEYGNAKFFYERAFITEGMGKLLTQVSQRLNGKGGEPLIQLQTSFGGGKTHTMLAVYHLGTRQCPLGDLAGIPPGPTPPGPIPPGPIPPGPVPPGPTPPGPTPTPKSNAFHGNVAINASTAKMRMVEVAEEIIAVLAVDPNAEVKVTVEIQVNFPAGASDQTKRAVTENARTLNFKNADWE